jgi:hypothetical protein
MRGGSFAAKGTLDAAKGAAERVRRFPCCGLRWQLNSGIIENHNDISHRHDFAGSWQMKDLIRFVASTAGCGAIGFYAGSYFGGSAASQIGLVVGCLVGFIASTIDTVRSRANK